MRRAAILMVLAILTLPSWGGGVEAQAEPESFVPFNEFLAGVREAKLAAEDPKALAEDGAGERELQRMRRHLLALYDGVEVPHSFVLDGQTFDCVPVLQQPALRGLKLDTSALVPPEPLPEPAPEGIAADSKEDAVRILSSPLTAGSQDAFGNAVRCDEGTIPMRRVTLAEMRRRGSLEGFFHKSPFGGDPGGTRTKEDEVVYLHKYAHAYQNVKNFGGSSWLNVWSPSIDGGASHVFSLAQHWYVASPGKNVQTVEGGWQVYPDKYGTFSSVLFIYWTTDGYDRTGCYNLDCAAFVQTNRNWPLGGTLTPDSARGGQQFQFQMQWKLSDDKWWLFLSDDGGTLEAVGYYPAALYGEGQLRRYATEIDLGGETVGAFSWPPMGSGAFAKRGAGQAAYQKRILYATSETTTKWAKLRVSQRSPKCYTLSLTPSTRGGSSGTFFYFGGPGGRGC